MKFPDVLIKYNYIYDLGFLFHWIQIKWKGFNIWPDDDGIETFFSEKGIREKENAVPGHCSHVGFNQITRKFR